MLAHAAGRSSDGSLEMEDNSSPAMAQLDGGSLSGFLFRREQNCQSDDLEAARKSCGPPPYQDDHFSTTTPIEAPIRTTFETQLRGGAFPKPQPATAAPSPALRPSKDPEVLARAIANLDKPRLSPTSVNASKAKISAFTEHFGPGRTVRTTYAHSHYLGPLEASTYTDGATDQIQRIKEVTAQGHMRKLPTQDLRMLWACIYGGEDAPWPGSLSPIIPGVTTDKWRGKKLHVDYAMAAWAWEDDSEEEGKQKK